MVATLDYICAVLNFAEKSGKLWTGSVDSNGKSPGALG
jgi:hypothetical protein